MIDSENYQYNKNILYNFEGKYPLESLVIEITNACNLKRSHCYGKFGEPSLKHMWKYEDIVKLKNELDILHTIEVRISGGEYLVTYYAHDDYDANAKNLFVASRGRGSWWSSKCLWCLTTIVIYYAVYIISIIILACGFSADMSIHYTPDFVVSVLLIKHSILVLEILCLFPCFFQY